MSNLIPAGYPVINEFNAAVSPSTVHVTESAVACMFRRYLLNEAMSPFVWTAPDYWDMNYFKLVLYIRGNIAVLRTDKYGVIPQHCTLGGRNVFYGPKWALVANPLFTRSYQLDIGKDCALIRLQNDFGGIADLITMYGDLMALTVEAAGVNLLNSKLSYVFAAKKKADAETFKKLYDQIAAGNPAAVLDKDLLDDEGKLQYFMFNQDVGGNYIADKLLESLRDIRAEFLTKIGIPNANTGKRERLITDEVHANDFETQANAIQWLENLKKGCAEVERLYPGTGLSVDWRPEIKEVLSNGMAVNSEPV